MVIRKYEKSKNIRCISLYQDDIDELLELLESFYDNGSLKIDYEISEGNSLVEKNNKEDFLKRIKRTKKIDKLEIRTSEKENFNNGNLIYFKVSRDISIWNQVNIYSDDEKWLIWVSVKIEEFLHKLYKRRLINKIPSIFYTFPYDIFPFIIILIYYIFINKYLPLPSYISIGLSCLSFIFIAIMVVSSFSKNEIKPKENNISNDSILKRFFKYLIGQIFGILLGIALTSLFTYLVKIFQK